MDKLRKAARDAIQRNPSNLPFLGEAMVAAEQNNLHQLWLDLSGHDSSTHLNVGARRLHGSNLADAVERSARVSMLHSSSFQLAGTH